MKTAFFFVLVLSLASVRATGQEPSKVETHGKQSKVMLEHLVGRHLQELNGKYKLRVAEVTYVPGGYIGPHHH
ncbi:MAG: hypothetical protein ACE5JX_16740 [Acidobacteriota bacterium]